MEIKLSTLFVCFQQYCHVRHKKKHGNFLPHFLIHCTDLDFGKSIFFGLASWSTLFNEIDIQFGTLRIINLWWRDFGQMTFCYRASKKKNRNYSMLWKQLQTVVSINFLTISLDAYTSLCQFAECSWQITFVSAHFFCSSLWTSTLSDIDMKTKSHFAVLCDMRAASDFHRSFVIIKYDSRS